MGLPSIREQQYVSKAFFSDSDCQSTDQLLSSFLRKQSLKHVHEEGSVVGYVMGVLRESEQEALVVTCTPATEPAKHMTRHLGGGTR